MNKKHITALESFLESKIDQLTIYREITKKMASSDLDEISELIAQRQMIINTVDGFSNEIKNIINIQDNTDKQLLASCFAFKKPTLPTELGVIYIKINKLEEILIGISKDERKATMQIENIQDELADEMQKSNKSKQVIDYCNSFQSNNIGGSFNSST